jgi:putative addiction module killer protein
MTESVRELRVLESAGRRPFERWYRSIGDKIARRRVFATITRLVDPTFAGFKSVGSGVFEARIFHGPGYRVYFGLEGDQLVILLGGGEKATQDKDIHEAKKLWKLYKTGAQGTASNIFDG